MCKNFASTQVAAGPEQANSAVVGSAVVGTLLGAVLGAAIGGGRGAGIGTVIGTGVGASNNAWSQMSLQQRYNIAYMQCVYAKGNQVPGYSVVSAPPY